MSHCLLILLLILITGSAGATALPSSNQPIVTAITATTATVSVSSVAYATMSSEEESRLYFHYYETEQVCIMIYPTPENCKPKMTTPGVLSTTLTNLKPNTSYTVVYKHDNTIRCITTPCPENGFESSPTTFTTKAGVSSSVGMYLRDLKIGSKGEDVIALQTMLREKGYLISPSTGYYGALTRAAVRLYQKNDMKISPTGTVGPKTRAHLQGSTQVQEETFSGKITAVSTACFADGECSVLVDGKKVVTTIGWRQGPVGSIKGTVSDIGTLESRIGTNVKVFAKKTTDCYTLYGDYKYYIEVLPSAPIVETFTGTVTNVEVWGDGPQYIFVDGKKILTSATNYTGTYTGVFGKAPYPSIDIIGSRVKVFARKYADSYSLEGNKAYYIKIL